MFKYLRPAFIITFGAILLLGNSLSAQQPQGKIISLDYKSDKHHSLYPGTERNIKVYVPEQYDGSKPACLYVGLDGILCNAPKVFDKLIAEGKIPVTIGIFVQPGVVYAKDKAKATAEAYNSARKVVRYNRSNEFDYTDGRFAEFLNNEIIPFVERKAVIEGKDIKIKISDNPNDRSIFGLSSGGIAAFNAAWFHPELFRRVFSGVGTFVSMRGGNDLQMLVRKCEPKPLRIFLQDGSNDVWNATFGHWYEANQMLSTALDFAGYDTRYDWSDGGHSVKRAAEIFEDVMIWLWADYPAPIKAGITKNDFLNKYIYKDSLPVNDLTLTGKQAWQKAQQKDIVKAEPNIYKFRTSTIYTASYPDSSFVVLSDYPFRSNTPNGNYLWQGVGKNMQSAEFFQRFYWLHSFDNTPIIKGPLAFDSKGNLFCLTNQGIQVFDQNGRVRFILEIPDEVEATLKNERTLHTLSLIIEEDKLIITDGTNLTFTRAFNISPALPGQTPKSQGQG
ncbi:MAG: hypothetical protein IKZ50_00160 [Bacteroidales bacterium]|nr:hypothetical protein [Bacteroidales bacterium]